MTSRNTKSPASKHGKTNSTPTTKSTSRAPGAPTRLGQITELLQRKGGASLNELCAATGWQAHSVRGAIAGALKKKGHSITSERINGVRRYQIGAPE